MTKKSGKKTWNKGEHVFPIRCNVCGAKITYENVEYDTRGGVFVQVRHTCKACRNAQRRIWRKRRTLKRK